MTTGYDTIDRLRAQLSLAERSVRELKADRNDVIEECARVAAQYFSEDSFEIATAIRGLKDKP